VATYTFGDDTAAVDRLYLVASAYEAVSRAFLGAHAPAGARVALDLGCGPGFSTQLVDEVCSPGALIGIDSSDRFLAVARATVPRAVFVTHDVTATPLPRAPADVMYARLLLAHLPDPLATARRWTSDLAPGGVLLIEDLEDIDAPAGPLRAYDEVSARIVRHGGGVMYGGAALAPLGGRHTPVTVRAGAAARIYRFNVRRWIVDPAVPVPGDELRGLLEELGAVADDDHGATVSWIVRQIALRR